MSLSHCNFYAILELPEGTHEYKFQVDGVWIHNQSQPVTRYIKKYAPISIGNYTHLYT